MHILLVCQPARLFHCFQFSFSNYAVNECTLTINMFYVCRTRSELPEHCWAHIDFNCNYRVVDEMTILSLFCIFVCLFLFRIVENKCSIDYSRLHMIICRIEKKSANYIIRIGENDWNDEKRTWHCQLETEPNKNLFNFLCVVKKTKYE